MLIFWFVQWESKESLAQHNIVTLGSIKDKFDKIFEKWNYAPWVTISLQKKNMIFYYYFTILVAIFYLFTRGEINFSL